MSRPEIDLIRIKKSDPRMQRWMATHYSVPKGFVGRQLIYSVNVEDVCYGAIAGGSATRNLPGRADFFGEDISINKIVNNIFFHILKKDGRYPIRNFATEVVKQWRIRILEDWPECYGGDEVLGFETLVELPRTGELYRRDGWAEIGITKGFSCMRIGGSGSDSWSGQRVWDTQNLYPKKVLARRLGAAA